MNQEETVQALAAIASQFSRNENPIHTIRGHMEVETVAWLVMEQLLREKLALEEKLRALSSSAAPALCQFPPTCNRHPTKGDFCEIHVCVVDGCTNIREKAFHTCTEH